MDFNWVLLRISESLCNGFLLLVEITKSSLPYKDFGKDLLNIILWLPDDAGSFYELSEIGDDLA